MAGQRGVIGIEPVKSRLKATVSLVRDDPFAVLLVTGNAQGFFPSARVFPGGVMRMIQHDMIKVNVHDTC